MATRGVLEGRIETREGRITTIKEELTQAMVTEEEKRTAYFTERTMTANAAYETARKECVQLATTLREEQDSLAVDYKALLLLVKSVAPNREAAAAGTSRDGDQGADSANDNGRNPRGRDNPALANGGDALNQSMVDLVDKRLKELGMVRQTHAFLPTSRRHDFSLNATLRRGMPDGDPDVDPAGSGLFGGAFNDSNGAQAGAQARRMPSMATRLPKPYNGETRFETWWKRMSSYLEMTGQHTTPVQKAQMITMCLADNVIEALDRRGLHVLTDPVKIVQHLQERYGDPKSELAYIGELLAMKQEDGERASHWLDRVYEMCELAYPEDDVTSHRFLKNVLGQFIQGGNAPLFGIALNMNPPTEMRALREQIVALETGLSFIPNLSSNLMPAIKEPAKKQAQLSSKAKLASNLQADDALAGTKKHPKQEKAVGNAKEAASDASNAASTAKPRFTCNHCGKTGHKAATCWQLHPELKAKAQDKPQANASGSLADVRCYRCARKGHTSTTCTERRHLDGDQLPTKDTEVQQKKCNSQQANDDSDGDQSTFAAAALNE